MWSLLLLICFSLRSVTVGIRQPKNTCFSDCITFKAWATGFITLKYSRRNDGAVYSHSNFSSNAMKFVFTFRFNDFYMPFTAKNTEFLRVWLGPLSPICSLSVTVSTAWIISAVLIPRCLSWHLPNALLDYSLVSRNSLCFVSICYWNHRFSVCAAQRWCLSNSIIFMHTYHSVYVG